MKVNHRFRFYPASSQKPALAKLFGCVRWTYNRALEYRSQTYKETGKGPSYSRSSAALSLWKRAPEHAFLREVSSVPLQQSLRHLQRAYINFFEGRARYPHFRTKRGNQSAEFYQIGFQLGPAKL